MFNILSNLAPGIGNCRTEPRPCTVHVCQQCATSFKNTRAPRPREPVRGGSPLSWLHVHVHAVLWAYHPVESPRERACQRHRNFTSAREGTHLA